MFRSILDDLKLQFNSGNMLTRIILINVAVFVFINILYVFTAFGSSTGIYQQIIEVLTISSDFPKMFIYVWTWITHMFLHEGFWHLLWNVLLLYWFGRIVGDFLGDDRILPIYLLGGFIGAVIFILTDNFLPFGSNAGAYAMGASAAVMAMLFTAASLSPDYEFNLLIIGRVKIKYIAIALLFMDFVGTASNVNTGGHWGHIGGALFGWVYVWALRGGTDLTEWMRNLAAKFNSVGEERAKKVRKKVPMEVVYNRNSSADPASIEDPVQSSFQKKLDDILDKINEKGISHLTSEEKEFLDNASKN